MSAAPKEQAKNPLAALLADSRKGAAQVEKGRFRLDWKKALDKVKRFQLTDPHRYVLELVQAAVAAGASKVSIEADSNDVWFHCDGDIPTADDLEHLFDYLFAQDTELTALKQLALGVNSALALEPRHIRVDAGDANGCHRLELSEHADLKVVPLDGEDRVEGVRIHVRDRFGWGVIGDAIKRITAEQEHLTQSCRYAPIPIELNGTNLAFGLGITPVCEHRFEASGVRGQLALPPWIGQQAELNVCMNGVKVTTLDLSQNRWVGALGVIGWIDDPSLTRNASHTDIHKDDKYGAMMSLYFRELRRMLIGYARQLLLEQKDRQGQYSELERAYLVNTARALLRAKQVKGRKGHKLKPELDALLDLPGIASLAVDPPHALPIRPLWEHFMKSGTVDVASQAFNVWPRDLPDGFLPITGPAWLFDEVFDGAVVDADAKLLGIELGQRNRREREELKREPTFLPGESLLHVPVVDNKRQIRGEVSLQSKLPDTLARLVDPRGGDVPKAASGESALVIYFNNGIPLGARWVESVLAFGVALLESDQFQPDDTWSDVRADKETRAAVHVVTAAVPAIVDALAQSFALLPPPGAGGDTSAWAPSLDERNAVLRDLTAGWPTDELSRKVRGHIDHIMARRKILRRECPALWSWRLFHTIEGEPVSLDQIMGNEPLADGRTVSPKNWRVVVAEAWGGGTPEGSAVLNVSPQQRQALERYLGHVPADGTAVLVARRAHLEERAEAERRRKANIARAELRRQSPVLAETEYEVIVDLPVPDGAGQVGIPRLGTETSWVRFLIDGLPLPDLKLSGPFPVQAVIESPAVSADDSFEGVVEDAGKKGALALIEDARPTLMERFAGTPSAMTKHGVRLIWQWLHQFEAGRKQRKNDPPPLERLPASIVDFPLLRTVPGDRISLRQITDDAKGHGSSIRSVEISPGRQNSDRPIVVCGSERRKTLGRLTGLKIYDYSRHLEKQIEALERQQRPPREPVLAVPTLLKRTIRADGFEGELGIWAGAVESRESGRVDVLIDRIPLESRPLELGGLPLVAVISSDQLKANKAWTRVVKNKTWKEAEQALRRTADELIGEACQMATDGAPMSTELRVALQRLCGQRFRGRPEMALEPKGSIVEPLAAAPLWESVDHRDYVTLTEIAEHYKRAGKVWHVSAGEGGLAPDRVIVRGDARTEAALRDIFGNRVRDGRQVFEQDQAAIRRRAAAPPIQTILPLALAPVDLVASSDELGLSIQGQVGLESDYRNASPGVGLEIGVDGRLLCTGSLEHRLRGQARVSCSGLEVNDQWTTPSDQQQMAWINEQIDAGMWRSAAALVAERPTVTGADAEDRRRTLIDALEGVLAGDGPEELRAPLMALPLFRTVARHAMSADELVTLCRDDTAIYAVSDELDEGSPLDGRLIIRAGRSGISALEYLLGDHLERDDDRWRRELEGAKQFQQRLPTEPALEGATAASYFFQAGETQILVGMLRPKHADGHGDDADPASKIRLHIGNRHLCTIDGKHHPAIEAWVNDDRLSPTNDFRGVVEDDVYRAVMQLVEDAIPELLARAAEHWASDPTDKTRLRLCRYTLDHHDELLATATRLQGSPAQRMLWAPMWECITGAGRVRLGTAQVQAARTDGRLRIAADDAPVEVPEQEIVVVLGAAEQAILEATGKPVADYTETLIELAARRVFLDRRQVDRIAVSEVTVEPLLAHQSLDEHGWEGEIGIPAKAGRTIELFIFVEHRRFTTIELPSEVRAVVCVQWQELAITPRYDGILQDARYHQLIAGIQTATRNAVARLAAAIGELGGTRGRIARSYLLDALGAAGAASREQTERPGFAAMVDALERAPLLADVRGQAWSIAALREAVPEGEPVRCVAPDTAAVGATDDRLVLVVDESSWVAVSRLIPIARDDGRYLESLEGARRRASAPTSYSMPRSAIAVADVSSPLFSGSLGLRVPIEPGSIGLFSRGRMVEERELPSLLGLCGHVDGALATNRQFDAVRLEPGHDEELTRLWEERLQAAVGAADDHGSRRGKRWQALAVYCQLFLLARLDQLGSSIERRRGNILAGAPDQPEPLRRAIALPIVRDNDGNWIDLATAIAGDDPVVIVSETRVKRPPRKSARLLLGDEHLLRLMSAVLGSGNVMTVQQARAAAERAKQKREEKEREAAEARAKRAATAHTRTFAALKSLLRETGSSTLPPSRVNNMRLLPAGKRSPLTANTVDAITINADHPMWKAAVAAKLDDAADAAAHLAVTVAACLVDDPDDCLAVLTRLAKRGRS